ncbi:MAG: 2-oxo acid dehydrogenase subunit E2 [Pseudomonadota bacterium]|nr:2-oxo acid dehydrogenase subunit E2 [Pseudomonadota bacterium]
MAVAIKIDATGGANMAKVVELPVASGDPVEAGQTVLAVENNKVVVEVVSPIAGKMIHALTKGDMVRLDVPIAFIAAKRDGAAALLAEAAKGIIGDGMDWDDIVADAASPRVDAGKPVGIAKATEIAVLGNGAGNSLLATLGTSIGPVPRSEGTSSFFVDKVSDLLVYEASRLLASKPYRILNAFFDNGHIVPRDRVVTGVSFDEGGRLTVYGIPYADKLSLSETQDALVGGLMRYIGKRLTIDDVTTATFTVSDVSTADINLSVPLLPRGQCIIIALFKDRAGSFAISISYDHRVTEGLTVANFAQELTKRIRSYAVDDGAARPAEPAVCAFCQRTAQAEVIQFRRRGLLKIVDQNSEELLCCSSCWENW